jgi:hypothetical protein
VRDLGTGDVADRNLVGLAFPEDGTHGLMAGTCATILDAVVEGHGGVEGRASSSEELLWEEDRAAEPRFRFLNEYQEGDGQISV